MYGIRYAKVDNVRRYSITSKVESCAGCLSRWLPYAVRGSGWCAREKGGEVGIWQEARLAPAANLPDVSRLLPPSLPPFRQISVP